MPRIMIIAGEASGELHGAGVVQALKNHRPDSEIFGIGGNRMAAAGCELLYHVEQFAFMGLVEVLRHLPFIRRAMRQLEHVFQNRRPNVLVLIDYPDFNLRLARIARRYDIPILYYISPQVWAWRAGRIHTIVKLVDRMAVVFPFEVDLYEQAGGQVDFVGHPLLDVLEAKYDKKAFCQYGGLDPKKPIIGLLPGSRQQEVSGLLPPMLDTLSVLQKDLTHVQGVIGLAPTIRPASISPFLKGQGSVAVVENMTYDVMKHADLLLVTSGTATLESACFGTPLIVLYKMARLSWWIARRVVTIPDIGLVNVVAGRRIAPEFLQHAVHPDKLVPEIVNMLQHPDRLKHMREELQVVRTKLGTPGASDRVAGLALEMVEWSHAGV
jgi:lipid-A-disaccharide synthase